MSKYDKYKESAFTHEEMQPMIIETDMTDIVERLRNGHDTCDFNNCRVREAKSGCTCAEAADEIERLRGLLINITGDALDIADACKRLADEARTAALGEGK